MTRSGFRFRRKDVCPWWAGFTLDNPLRRAVHDPDAIVSHCVEPGMTVLDLGCGAGFFTLALARRVGPGGAVIAADIQPRMLLALAQRAWQAGVLDRIEPLLSDPGDLHLGRPFDFVLAFWMLHEARDPRRLLSQVHERLNADGRLLLVEPRLHVRAHDFDATLQLASAVGFRPISQPAIRWSYSALLTKA